MAYKGLDSVIEVIRSKVTFTWLEQSFGLADRIVEMREEKPYIFPAIYDHILEPVSMMPSDLWDSFCFWTKKEETKFDVTDEIAKISLLIDNVSCIFYMSLVTSDYKETKSKIIEDIINLFSKMRLPGILTFLRFIEGDITKVYDGYTLDQLDNKFKIYPKWCCRFDFELKYRYDCYVT